MQLAASAPSDYLGCDAFVQSDHPAVIELGAELRRRHRTDVDSLAPPSTGYATTSRTPTTRRIRG
jgi:hypothetical protein